MISTVICGNIGGLFVKRSDILYSKSGWIWADLDPEY